MVSTCEPALSGLAYWLGEYARSPSSSTRRATVLRRSFLSCDDGRAYVQDTMAARRSGELDSIDELEDELHAYLEVRRRHEEKHFKKLKADHTADHAPLVAEGMRVGAAGRVGAQTRRAYSTKAAPSPPAARAEGESLDAPRCAREHETPSTNDKRASFEHF